ncbi:FixH family protein [Novosphingobium sp. RD2P27]|uniref:FixH family protein n=1 Tax=Novosphingobium kalidii TaxID=3230299 RepID=A0ABV2D2P0_9SPHN
MTPQPTRAFTGRHIATIMVGFFGVVITVNVMMARMANSTFGGVVVENSYVASQHYNRWLDEAAAEEALGWTAEMARRADGHVALELKGPAATPQAVFAVARHPLGQLPERVLHFDPAAPESFVSAEELPAGRWRLRLEVRSDGKLWRSEGDVR